jgi:hypothetical protein
MSAVRLNADTGSALMFCGSVSISLTKPQLRELGRSGFPTCNYVSAF